LTREAIPQSGIHHETAALDYSYWGWKSGGGLVYRLVFCFFLLLRQQQPAFLMRNANNTLLSLLLSALPVFLHLSAHTVCMQT
jgi:hypothetical protein